MTELDEELEEIRQYRRVRCPRCLDFWWMKTRHRRNAICPDCKRLL